MFKMAAFGLYTQSGPFSTPTEMGVRHHVGSNSDIARASVWVYTPFLKELQILSKKVCVNVTFLPLQASVMKPGECYRPEKFPNCKFHKFVMTDSDPYWCGAFTSVGSQTFTPDFTT